MALIFTVQENDSVYMKCSDGIIQTNVQFKNQELSKIRFAIDAPNEVNILRGVFIEEMILNNGWVFAGTDSSGWKLWKDKLSGVVLREIEVVRRYKLW